MFAHDLMEIALGRLYSVAVQYDETARIESERLAMFSDAWTIVDQVHVVRQALSALTDKSTRAKDTQTYLDDYEVAREMRNRMDHLSGNLANRAGAKGPTQGLFGMLSFFRPDPERWEAGLPAGEVRGDFFVISAGSSPGDMVGALAWHELDVHLPVCSFKLEAFDRGLLLERAVLQLRPLLRRLSDDLRRETEKEIDAYSEAMGVPKDQLMAPASGHIVVRMDFGFPIEQQGPKEPGSDAVSR